jgi:hypothetical protein
MTMLHIITATLAPKVGLSSVDEYVVNGGAYIQVGLYSEVYSMPRNKRFLVYCISLLSFSSLPHHAHLLCLVAQCPRLAA